MKEIVDKYQEEIEKLVDILEEQAEPIEAEIKHKRYLIRKIQANCEHSYSSWSGNQYNRERECSLCGYKSYRG